MSNLSDLSDEEDSSSGESKTVSLKRNNYDFDNIPIPSQISKNDYGASSTTSQGSGQDIDDESPERPNLEFSGNQQSSKVLSFADQSPDGRRDISSLSDNCSSPNEQNDFRPKFDDNDADQGAGLMRPSLQDTDHSTGFSKDITHNDMDGAFSLIYSEKSKRMMSSMGYKPGRGLYTAPR